MRQRLHFQHVRALTLPLLLLASCSGRLLRIDGSSCATVDDCAAYPSCSERANGCRCDNGACWLDPKAPMVDPAKDPTVGCRSCHGSLANSAPPAALDGSTDTASLGVGAHQIHLQGGRSSRPLACEDCHIVPAQTNDPGHIDGDNVAEVTWGAVATSRGASPSWDRTTATCNTAYCHGSTLEGQNGKELLNPTWTAVDGLQGSCGSCHGLPPGPPHPANTRCEICHLPTAGPNQTIANRQTHVDGVLQVSADDCTGCHGNSNNLAPPKDANGHSDLTNAAIGAHQAHVAASRFSRPVACGACHIVPAKRDDPGHLDTPLPAEVTFKELAVMNGSKPTYAPSDRSCANTYCHGATLTGGTHTTPLWTESSGAGAACGTCHGLPPPPPHPPSPNCQLCHSPTAGPNQTIADVTTHIDGTLQVSDGSCADCHGSTQSSAPPPDTDHAVDTSLMSVGAHQSHLFALSGLSRPVSCSECHIVPQHVNDPGHVDTPRPAEVSWGTLATANGARPAFDPIAGTCSDTYCHGATLRDAYLSTPIWTTVDGTQDACGTCHGVPPSGPHPQNSRCELCHLPTAGPNQTIADPTTHIDGVVQTAMACDSCHGQNGNSAPPVDTQGRTSTSLTSVGAHQTHLAGGTSAKPVACSECHRVPVNVDDPGHNDTPLPAEVVFGPLSASKHSPAYASPTCSDTYCHSGVGATNPRPTWNKVDGTEAACGSCHGTPPNTPAHQGAGPCANCHLPTAGQGLTIANRATHVDGILQVSDQSCNACHGSAANAAPPNDLNGDSSPADPEVGAHQVHLTGGSVSAPVACNSCHLVPVNVTDPGHTDTPPPAEVTFSGYAVAQGSTPTWDTTGRTCSGVYCHGAASTLATDPTPTWNAPGSVTCGSCHGLPPAPPHPQVDRCELCHAAVAGANHTIIDRSKHVNGVVDVNDVVSCQSCHGSATNAAPPKDLAGNTSSAAVGAHQAHLVGTGSSRPVPCAECHIPVNPSAPNQAGHYDTALPAEVTFGVLARTSGVNPAWSGTSCTNTYCHGATLLGGTTASPAWTAGALACNACHGMPPNNSYHGNGTQTQCEKCHTDDAGANHTITNPSLHVDGTVQLSVACDACHGGAGDPTPPKDTLGNTTSNAVGVHQAHKAPAHSAPVACSTCHKVPTNYKDPGHVDTGLPAEVLLAGRASLGGATPIYTHANLTCTGTYCHGVSLPGGKTQVTWNDYTGVDAACGGCHGMPPADTAHAGVSGPNTCNSCHTDSAGPNQTITNPALHLDGVVQVSGGGCTSCHPSLPTPANQNYANGGGAHTQHAAAGIGCVVCHGNNGSGATHNQGNGTVSRANVNIVFDATVAFPGGTSMKNGQAAATWTQSTQTCKVGCHNPVVGNPKETPNLTVGVTWTAGPQSCVSCHDSVQTAPPYNHNIAAQGDAACATCHDPTGHMAGTGNLKDPDPSDAFVPAPANWEPLCKTCHDGAGGTAFGGQTARDASQYWTVSTHGTSGIKCGQCHTYHASTGGPVVLDRSSSACMAAGCHDAKLAEFAQVSGGPISHHRIEGGTNAVGTIALNCNDCHNAHVAQKSPLSAIDPDNRWVAMSVPSNAGSIKKSAGNYTTFCLRCHDGTPPLGVAGAMNIQQALSGGTDPSQFKTGSSSQHRSNHSGFNCQSCHDWHGSPGTKGTYNRGLLLLNYLGVSGFPYSGKGSCSTSGSPVGCH